MNTAIIYGYIIPFIFIMASLIAFFICSLARYRCETDAGDDIAAGHTMIRALEIIVLIVVLGGLFSMIVRNRIQTYDKEQERYNKAVRNGYTLYYNGQKSDADAVGITQKNIYAYNIEFDDTKKIIRVKH